MVVWKPYLPFMILAPLVPLWIRFSTHKDTKAPGKLILSVVGFGTSTACYIADFNDSHIYHPGWMPHAKFHAGQTMSLGLVLGLLTLYLLWRKEPTYTKDSAWLAALVGGTYWITQLSAILYPNTLAADPPAPATDFPQLYPSLLLMAMSVLGYVLEARRLDAAKSKNL